MTDVLKGKQILVVEDQCLIAADLCRALHALGADVIGPTGNFDDALYLASHAMVDGALVDVNLGDRLAYPVIEQLMKRGLPCLLLTGYDRESLPDAFQECPWLAKPVTAELALDRLIEVLSASALNRGA